MEAYDELIKIQKELATLLSLNQLIQWDTFTAIPPGAVKMRAEQQAAFGKIEHQKSTDPEVDRLLKEIESSPKFESLSVVQKRNAYLIRRDFDLYTVLPEELYGQWWKQSTITNQAREKAKANKDWSMFEPEFRKMVDVIFAVSDCMMDVVGVSNRLDVNIDLYQEGMTSELLSPIFDEISKEVVPLVKKYSPLSEEVKTDFLNRKVERDTQMRIAEDLAEIFGYDLKSEEAVGKLGESVHPMSIGSYDDVRISLYYDEHKFLDSFYAFIHECGHALYNINLNREHMFEPVGLPGGFGLHESQSRFLENMVGRSSEFLGYFLPRLNTLTGDLFSDINVEHFVRAVNQVKPGVIRVNSDELTYSLHIILRFEIEKDLFAGKIEISEIPRVWNDLYEKYLGVQVENDGEGALQDMHWGVGQFGHFPCYTLGNIFAAQLVEAMETKIPDWGSQIVEGKFHNVIGWMIENVHKNGQLYDAPGLMKHVTGKKISVKPYIKYLEKKYSTLYG